MRGLRQLWRSGEGPALLAALVFCVVTAILMVNAELLPVDDGYGIAGVLFIYVTVFVLAGGIFKMIIRPVMRRWQKASGEGQDPA
ncbi:MAG: hypothetical protein OXO52_05240 [Rhodospirillales bacterium]|nr:hypothetical protein [Rhodospirillales bacterium]MDE0382025.1 hypothetical protein [Rhodospirillales bacterium]